MAPRSFTPGPVSSVTQSAAITGQSEAITPGPVQSAAITSTGDKFRLGSVVVGASEELSFQPGLKAFKPENYKVTDFSHQTTAQGHTYR